MIRATSAGPLAPPGTLASSARSDTSPVGAPSGRSPCDGPATLAAPGPGPASAAVTGGATGLAGCQRCPAGLADGSGSIAALIDGPPATSCVAAPPGSSPPALRVAPTKTKTIHTPS